MLFNTQDAYTHSNMLIQISVRDLNLIIFPSIRFIVVLYCLIAMYNTIKIVIHIA